MTALVDSMLNFPLFKSYIEMSDMTLAEVEATVLYSISQMGGAVLDDIHETRLSQLKKLIMYNMCLYFVANCSLYDFTTDNISFKRFQLLKPLQALCDKYNVEYQSYGPLEAETDLEVLVLLPELDDCY